MQADEIFAANFEQLDTALDDPLVKRLLVPAQEWNEYLLTEQVDNADATRIIEDLDETWKRNKLMRGEVEVTGQLYTEDESRFAAGESMLSNGFTIMRDASGRQKIMLQLAEPVIDENGSLAYKLWSSGIEGTHLEFTKMSRERARAWLEAFYPDLIAHIDDVLFNGDEDESEVMSALGGLIFDQATYGDDLERVEQSVALYLEDVLKFDTTLPYVIGVSGKIGYYNPQTEQYEVERSTSNGYPVLFMLKALCTATLSETPDDIGKRTLSLGGKLILDVDREVPGRKVIIPLDTLTSFKAVRDEYYNQAD